MDLAQVIKVSALMLIPGWAAAHPVDEVVQAAYLTLSPAQVQLELDLTPGTEVLGAVLALLDPDADGQVTEAEAQAFATTVLAQSSLTQDGAPLAWHLTSITVPPLASLQEGTDVIRLYATAARPDVAGAHDLTYATTFHPAKSLWMANIFLQPGDWVYTITGQTHSADGGQLAVTFTANPA